MRKIAMAIDTPMPGNVSYDEFIALCFMQMKGRDPDGQRDITLGRGSDGVRVRGAQTIEKELN